MVIGPRGTERSDIGPRTTKMMDIQAERQSGRRYLRLGAAARLLGRNASFKTTVRRLKERRHGRDSKVFHYGRGDTYDMYLRFFDMVWEDSEPLPK
jgi:hypothetical protein